MLPMLAMTALSGGLSFMSGIGGRNSAKKQARLQQIENDRVRVWNESEIGRTNEWNYNLGRELLDNPTIRRHSEDMRTDSFGGVDVDRMMADADRAGFNPVTWLQSGALQAYGYTMGRSYGWTEDSETNPVEAFRMMLKTPNLQSADTVAKIPDAMEIIGDAGQAALNTFRSEYAREDSQAFQREQLGLQLAAIQAGKQKASFGSIPRETTSGGRTVTAAPLLAGADALLYPKTNQALTTMDNAEIKQPEVTPSPFGRRSFWQNDLRWPDTSGVTNVYGEGADVGYGPPKFANDVLYNFSRPLMGGRGFGYYDLMDMLTVTNQTRRDAIGSPRPWLQQGIDAWNSINSRSFLNNPGSQPWLGSGM